MIYKEIVIPYLKQLTANDLKAINRFNAFFAIDSVQLEEADGRLVVKLREVDISHIRKIADDLSVSVSNGIFADVVKAIEGIKSYGIRGKKRNYVDYNKERKVKDRKRKEANRCQHFYTDNNDFTCDNQEVPPEYINRIIVGDSKEVLKRLPDNCVDLIFTSPPYNFGLDYASERDDHHWENYFETLFGIFKECIRVLKHQGRIAVNVQPLFSDYIPSHHLISNFFIKEKMIWKGEILWEKNNYNCKYTAWGSWKSPSSPYLKYTWEFVEVFCKGELIKKGESKNIDIDAEEFKKWVVAKWSIAPERKMKEYEHPAMFPEELAKRILKLFSYKGDVILDPFNVIGTTCAVAKKLGRKYIGIDISGEYCQKTEQRLAKISHQEGLLENGEKS